MPSACAAMCWVDGKATAAAASACCCCSSAPCPISLNIVVGRPHEPLTHTHTNSATPPLPSLLCLHLVVAWLGKWCWMMMIANPKPISVQFATSSCDFPHLPVCDQRLPFVLLLFLFGCRDLVCFSPPIQPQPFPLPVIFFSSCFFWCMRACSSSQFTPPSHLTRTRLLLLFLSYLSFSLSLSPFPSLSLFSLFFLSPQLLLPSSFFVSLCLTWLAST